VLNKVPYYRSNCFILQFHLTVDVLISLCSQPEMETFSLLNFRLRAGYVIIPITVILTFYKDNPKPSAKGDIKLSTWCPLQVHVIKVHMT
jgi:hypothetical protein